LTWRAKRAFIYENAKQDIPEGCEATTIPSFTWAVFPCIGPLPDAQQDVNTRIFSEWLPAKGTSDKNYLSEIWIPVARK
jgi:AraC family transcriptional regulator